MKRKVVSLSWLMFLLTTYSTSASRPNIQTPPLCACTYYVPNAFSPNGDGYNDLFTPYFGTDCTLTSYVLRIYNRWGMLVFESNDLRTGWNGTFRGEMAPQGAYVYTIQYLQASDSAPEPLVISGSLSLLR